MCRDLNHAIQKCYFDVIYFGVVDSLLRANGFLVTHACMNTVEVIFVEISEINAWTVLCEMTLTYVNTDEEICSEVIDAVQESGFFAILVWVNVFGVTRA
jgi:hypothetical protein